MKKNSSLFSQKKIKNNYFVQIFAVIQLYSCMVIGFTACKTSTRHGKIGIGKSTGEIYVQLTKVVRPGDIIFRNGNDNISRAARSMNRTDTSFSHSGILFIENDSAFVYHALGGDYNPGGKLKREWLYRFIDTAENNRIAVYRYKLNTPQITTLKKLAYTHYAEGLLFDLYFNLYTDDKMYCTEFVFKCVNRATGGLLNSITEKHGFNNGITPDDLYLHPLCSQVTDIFY